MPAGTSQDGDAPWQLAIEMLRSEAAESFGRCVHFCTFKSTSIDHHCSITNRLSGIYR